MEKSVSEEILSFSKGSILKTFRATCFYVALSLLIIEAGICPMMIIILQTCFVL